MKIKTNLQLTCQSNNIDSSLMEFIIDEVTLVQCLPGLFFFYFIRFDGSIGSGILLVFVSAFKCERENELAGEGNGSKLSHEDSVRFADVRTPKQSSNPR